jgi:hypothetical protein
VSTTVDLMANAQRMLVNTQSDLLDLADEIGKGERQGRDGETVMRLNAISQRIGEALTLLFHEESAPVLADG